MSSKNTYNFYYSVTNKHKLNTYTVPSSTASSPWVFPLGLEDYDTWTPISYSIDFYLYEFFISNIFNSLFV